MNTVNRPEPKIRRVLRFLASGRSLTRFSAEHEVHDHCLNATIAEISKRYGLHIDRFPTKVRGFAGTMTRCNKYRLVTEAQRDKAREILQKMRK